MRRKSKKVSLFAILLVIPLIALASIYTQAAEDSQWDIDGYLMYDYDHFSPFFLESPSAAEERQDFITAEELRRARLSIKYSPSSHWGSKVQVNFDESSDGDLEMEFKDVYFRYKTEGSFIATVGKQKEPFGLENQMSSRTLYTIERSVANNAIAPGRSTGISVGDNVNQFYWSAGIFKSNDDGAARAVTARVAYSPWQKKDSLVHFGLSHSYRVLNNDEFRVNETLDIRGADSFIEGESINAKRVNLSGIDALWLWHSVSVSGEYFYSSIADDEEIQDSQRYSGGYLNINYVLGTAKRKYKRGVLGSVAKSKTKNYWELNYRASQFDLHSEGNMFRSHAFGVNYYINKYAKLMAHYIVAEKQGEGVSPDSGNAISLRAQLSF